MRQLRQDRGGDWALTRLKTIGEACCAMLNETLRATITWAIDQARDHEKDAGHVLAKLRVSVTCKSPDIRQICGYFEKNKHRMHYNEYLEKGYPIASGVIEGACRHLVKDRLERTGMNWTVPVCRSHA